MGGVGTYWGGPGLPTPWPGRGRPALSIAKTNVFEREIFHKIFGYKSSIDSFWLFYAQKPNCESNLDVF